MLDKELRVLEILNRNSGISQRSIAAAADISIGNVNSIIKHLVEDGYISIDKHSRKSRYVVNKKGLDALEEHINGAINKKIIIPKHDKKVNTAVVLAAGESLNFDKPVGFLPLGRKTIIERILDILEEYGIENIIVVAGYESHYYEKLAKERKISLVKNRKYKSTGTMTSLAAAKDLIKDDFILIESDIVFEKRAIGEVLKNENRDCVLISSVSGSGDEVFVEIRNTFIFKMSKDKHQFNKIDGEMIGISKISIDIYKKMLEEFSGNSNPYLNYEYVLLDVARTYNIGYAKIEDLIWTEIDTQWHYSNLVNFIFPMLENREKHK